MEGRRDQLTMGAPFFTCNEFVHPAASLILQMRAGEISNREWKIQNDRPTGIRLWRICKSVISRGELKGSGFIRTVEYIGNRKWGGGKLLPRKAHEHLTRVSSRMDSHRIRVFHSHLRVACLSRRGFSYVKGTFCNTRKQEGKCAGKKADGGGRTGGRREKNDARGRKRAVSLHLGTRKWRTKPG
jgi:hypothetical protein